MTHRLPSDLDAERAVLGALLLRGRNALADVEAQRISEEDFSATAHAATWRAIATLVERGQPIDALTVASELRARDELAPPAGESWESATAALLDEVPASAHAEHYARLVRGAADLRALMKASHEIIAAAADGSGNEREVLDQAQAQIAAIADRSAVGATGYRRLGQVMRDVVKGAEWRHLARKDGRDVAVPTGVPRLDAVLRGGLRGGKLYVVAGRPGHGKSSLALTLLLAAANAGVPGLLFSLEMSDEEFGERYVAGEGVDSEALAHGKLESRDWIALTRAVERAQGVELYIQDRAALSLADVRASARRFALDRGVRRSDGAPARGMIVVDYLQLMRAAPKRGERDFGNREQAVAEMSRGMKELAKQLDMPVVALAQLNRELERRPDKRPIMSDLRESGSIEQDADAVLFVYRDELYNPESKDRGIAEIIVGKQRGAPPGMARARFDGRHGCRFRGEFDGDK